MVAISIAIDGLLLLPIPDDVIDRVRNLARQANTNLGLVFTHQHGNPIVHEDDKDEDKDKDKDDNDNDNNNANNAGNESYQPKDDDDDDAHYNDNDDPGDFLLAGVAEGPSKMKPSITKMVSIISKPKRRKKILLKSKYFRNRSQRKHKQSCMKNA